MSPSPPCCYRGMCSERVRGKALDDREAVMDALRKLAGVYLVLVAIAVAVFFIVNPLLVDSIDVPAVWSVIDILMVIALALGLLFAYLGKQRVDAQGSRATAYRERTWRPTSPSSPSRLSPSSSCTAGSRCSQAGRTSPGRQPSGMGDLGGRRHGAADRLGGAGMQALAGRLGATPQLTPPQTGGGEHISNAGAQGRCRVSSRS